MNVQWSNQRASARVKRSSTCSGRRARCRDCGSSATSPPGAPRPGEGALVGGASSSVPMAGREQGGAGRPGGGCGRRGRRATGQWRRGGRAAGGGRGRAEAAAAVAAAANKEAAGAGGRPEPSAAEPGRAGPSRAGPDPGARGRCGRPGRGRRAPDPCAPGQPGSPAAAARSSRRPAMAGVSYAAPWWVSLLHRLPHFNLRWETTSSQFRPEDTDYQQVTRAPWVGDQISGHGPPPCGSRSPFPGSRPPPAARSKDSLSPTDGHGLLLLRGS